MNKESKFEYLDNFLRALGIQDSSFIINLDNYLINKLNSDAKKKLDWDCITLLIKDRNNNFFQNGKYTYFVCFIYNDTEILCSLIWYDKNNLNTINCELDTSHVDIHFELEYNNDLEINNWDLFPAISTEFIKYKFKPIKEYLFVSRRYKWLEHFAYDNKFENIVFINKMDNIIKEKIEKWLDSNLDWNNIMLRNLYPCRTSIYTHTLNNGGVGYIYRGHLQHMIYMDSTIPIDIIWYNPPQGNEIDIQSLPPEIDLVFEIKIYTENDFHLDGEFLAKPTKKSKIINLIFKLKFPATTTLDSMPHEGKFAITLWNTEDAEKVSTSLEKARSDWNKQTDNARETGDESLERGYCHDIAFDGLDGKVGYWYVDAGSAHDGIHEFLLKGLSESGIKIKHVEIQGL